MFERQKKKIKSFVILVLALLFMFALFVLMIKLLGTFLVIEDRPKKSDAIVVLGGEEGADRVRTAAELFHKGFASRIILTGAPAGGEVGSAKYMSYQITKFGVPREALILENQAKTTHENATHVKAVVSSMGFKSAIVVSSSYHMRRARMIFNKVFDGTDVKLLYSPVRDIDYLDGSWWKYPEKRINVFSEYAKLIYYQKYLF